MTVDWLVRDRYGGNWDKALKRQNVPALFSAVTLDQWLLFFNDFKETYIAGLDPNTWPSFRKMLLRVLSSKVREPFGKGTEKSGEGMPDVEMVEGLVAQAVDAAMRVGRRKPNLASLAKQASAKVEDIIRRLGVRPVPRKVLETAGRRSGREQMCKWS